MLIQYNVFSAEIWFHTHTFVFGWIRDDILKYVWFYVNEIESSENTIGTTITRPTYNL